MLIDTAIPARAIVLAANAINAARTFAGSSVRVTLGLSFPGEDAADAVVWNCKLCRWHFVSVDEVAAADFRDVLTQAMSSLAVCLVVNGNVGCEGRDGE